MNMFCTAYVWYVFHELLVSSEKLDWGYICLITRNNTKPVPFLMFVVHWCVADVKWQRRNEQKLTAISNKNVELQIAPVSELWMDWSWGNKTTFAKDFVIVCFAGKSMGVGMVGKGTRESVKP